MKIDVILGTLFFFIFHGKYVSFDDEVSINQFGISHYNPGEVAASSVGT